MSYKLKGNIVIINGIEQTIVPGTLPGSPSDGHYAIDSSDGKLKVWHTSKNRWIILGDAEDMVFDNYANGFTSNNTQNAIEEAYSLAIAKPRYSIITLFNGTVGNNDWLGYSELIPGDQVPIRIPRNCKLREISVSYKNTDLFGIPTGGNLITGKLQIYKNGNNDPSNIIHIEQFTNQAGGKIISGLNLSLNQADFIVSKWKDEGNNPSDMAICYFFEVT